VHAYAVARDLRGAVACVEDMEAWSFQAMEDQEMSSMCLYLKTLIAVEYYLYSSLVQY
jgi:hypothetical protein